jgi:hypothetical protein
VLNLDSERRILDETLGVPSINAFRPPYGSYDTRVLEVAGRAGYPLVVGWDVDSKDQSGAPSVAAEVANATAGTNGSIVLMHCGSPLTPLALPAIIDRYRARGFDFVTIPQMFGLPSPAAGWAPPPSPDAWPVTELATDDLRGSWNASPAIDASGHLHLAYETPAGIVYGDDASGSWQSETVARSTSSTFVSRPSIALDPDEVPTSRLRHLYRPIAFRRGAIAELIRRSYAIYGGPPLIADDEVRDRALALSVIGHFQALIERSCSSPFLHRERDEGA